MLPYESLYNFRTLGDNLAVANDVNSALVPAIMRAHFPDYLTNSLATINTKKPERANAMGQFDPDEKTISLAPVGYNRMYMARTPRGDYLGDSDTNTTTDDTLNGLFYALHESYHARIHPSLSRMASVAPMLNFFKRDPAKDLKNALGSERYAAAINELRNAKLPSMSYKEDMPDSSRLNEVLSTVIPAQQMRSKNIATPETKRYLAEYERIANKYPELRGVIKMWEKPEQFR